MKTKYKAIIAICCVLLAGCVTAAVILLMPDRTTADNDEADPSEVDKFTVDDEYKDVLEEIKNELPNYYRSDSYMTTDLANSLYNSPRDYSITEDSIAGRQLFDGHMFPGWRDSDFDDSTLKALYIKKAIALQYQRYLSGLFVNEYVKDLPVRSWLGHRINEIDSLLIDIQYGIDHNLPEIEGGLGGDYGWPETGEQFVPETVIPVTPLPETAVAEE